MEEDGSGHFQTLQEAADAAASGDTIMVGPGRYSGVAVAPWLPSSYSKNLTYIGEDVETVIIGPEVYDYSSTGMYIREEENSIQHISAITFQNLGSGINFNQGSIDNCRFIGCRSGALFGGSSERVTVTNCTFEGLDNTTDIGYSVGVQDAVEVFMENCLSKDMGVSLFWVDSFVIRNCNFPKTISSGDMLVSSSSGLIEDCRISGYLTQYQGIMTLRNCDLTVNDTLHRPNFGCDLGETILENNVFNGGSGTEPTIVISTTPSTRVHGSGNHILKNEDSSYTIRIHPPTSGARFDHDLRDNYWGTSEASQIAAWILDADDDPDLSSHVLFDPFSAEPLPSEEKSFGSVKAMFR